MSALAPRMLAFAACATLVCGCGGGRAFKAAASLSEGRPVRVFTAVPAELDDEPFRATPPARTSDKARPLPSPAEVHLSNGVRVVMLERHDFPSISMAFVLDRGAAAAPPGVAALYAEALTGTSAEYKSGEAWEYLSFVGGSVATYAWRDATMLQVTAVTPLFVSALSRAAPMFTNPELESDDLEDARTQLAARQAENGEEPSDVAHDALYAAVFPALHPYAVPIYGLPARAKRGANADARQRVQERATDAAVRAFRDGTLAADRVSVACVGDFKPALIQKVLENALGKLPKHATAPAPTFPPVPPNGGRKVTIIDRPGSVQSSVAIGWPGPRGSERDVVALDVLASATAGELSTRLNITVRKELGATYGVHMTATAMRDGGLIQIAASIDTARTVDAMKGLLAELGRLRTEPISAAELGAAKLRTYHDLEHSSTRGLARYLAYALAEDKPVAHAVTYNARIDVITAEEVRAAAEKWLAVGEARIVIVGDASRIADGLRSLDVGEVSVTTPR